nr:dedicator of cytokinesis protein [Hymenolepis microstoma]
MGCGICEFQQYSSRLVLSEKKIIGKKRRLSPILIKLSGKRYLQISWKLFHIFRDSDLLKTPTCAFQKLYYIENRRTLNSSALSENKQQSLDLIFDCDEGPEASEVSFSLGRNKYLISEKENVTNFSKDHNQMEISDFSRKLVDTNYYAKTLANHHLIEQDNIRNSTKFIPQYRLASPGAWVPDCRINENLKRRPLFLLFRSSGAISKTEFNMMTIYSSIYLFDAIHGCRISEEFNLQGKTTGVFRVTDRWRELIKTKEVQTPEPPNKELESYLEGVYLVIKVSKVVRALELYGDNADMVMMDSKSVKESRGSSKGSDILGGGGVLLKPYAWTAVDISALAGRTWEETHRISRRRCLSGCERPSSADRRDSQCQRRLEELKRNIFTSESQEMTRQPTRSASNERFSSPNVLEGLENKLQINDFGCRRSYATHVPNWRSPKDKSRDTSDFVELDIQLNTRVFIKEEPGIGNHMIEQIIVNASKMKSSMNGLSPWVHEVPLHFVHGHSNRRIKTITCPTDILVFGQIVSPYGFSKHLKVADLCTAEGEQLLTQNQPEIKLQEVVEFPTSGRVFPFKLPKNLLYIYPKSINLGSPKNTPKNLEVIIQLRYWDSTSSYAIPAFLGCNSSTGLQNETRIHVDFKNRSSELTDEIKVILPIEVTQNHYLFFTFVHVSSGPGRLVRELVRGYSWFPVFYDGSLCSGDESLYLSQDRPSSETIRTISRISKDSREDPTKDVFNLRFVPISSLYPDGFALKIMQEFREEVINHTVSLLNDQYLLENQTDFEKESVPILEYFLKANLNQLISYLSPIMDGLLQILGVSLIQEMDKAAQNALVLLGYYLHHVTKGLTNWKEQLTGRNHFICAYLSGIGECSLENALIYLLSGYPLLGLAWVDDISRISGDDAPKKLYEKLLQCLVAQFEKRLPFVRLFYKETLWFFLELLVRTLMEENSGNSGSIGANSVKNLDLLTSIVTKDICRCILEEGGEDINETTCQLNRTIAFFLHDLLSCLNTSYVFRFTRTYIEEINNAIKECIPPKAESAEDGLVSPLNAKKIRNLELLKLEMLQIVAAAPECIQLNFLEADQIASSMNMMRKREYQETRKSISDNLTIPEYEKPHFLPTVLLKEIDACLLHSDPVLSEISLDTLFSLLGIHELEGSSSEIRNVGALYLPFLNIACDQVADMYGSWFHNLEKRERVSREVEKLATLLESHKNGNVNGGSMKRSGWILASMSAKERVKRLGRRRSVTPAQTEQQSSSNLLQGYSTSKRASKSWIYDLIAPAPFLIASEASCQFNETIKHLILVEMLWILQNTQQDILKCWFTNADIKVARNIVALLILALEHFEYSSGTEISKESLIANDISNTGFFRTKRLESLESRKIEPADQQERSKLLNLCVTSIVCRTLDLIADVYCNPSLDEENAEKAEETICTNRLIEIMARAFIFGLNMPQCAKTFRLLCCGISNLFSKFPTYFLNETTPSSTVFALCRVLLSHAISPLSKIRKISNAALFCIFHWNYKINGHLFHANNYAILALHAHLAPKDLSPEQFSSSSWLLPHLNKINDCLSEYSESPNASIPWVRLLAILFHNQRIPQASVDKDLFILPPSGFMDNRLLMASAHFPICFDVLKKYAAKHSNMPHDVKRQKPTNAIRFALDYINQHAQDAGLRGQISATVQDLQTISNCLNRLSELQKNSIGSQKVEKEDQHFVIETLVELASACRLVPELRQYWLLRLTEVHLLFKQPAEAAQALLHTLALDIEQLVSRKSASLPNNLSEGVTIMARQLFIPNVLEESALGHAVGLPVPFTISGEYIQQKMTVGEAAKRFSEFVEKVIKCFRLAEQFELIPPVCEWIIQILHTLGDQDSINNIKRFLGELEGESIHSHQLFGTYFRVGFYGRPFGDQDGKEYIYKEAPLTKLPEIASRLHDYYSNQLGGKPVEVIRDSKPVVDKDLSSTTAYLQITYVEPYFEEFELRKRKNETERNYGIKRFVMVIPFTQKGSAHGGISEQYKRKVILEVPRTFPYLNTRLPVISRKELILSPIEVALEDVAKRNQQLAVAINTNPPDAKFLQMAIQGCVSTTVHQGPLEVASSFLNRRDSPLSSDIKEDVGGSADISVDDQNELRLCLKEFLRISQEAVRLSRQLIGQDQEEYQRELERNFVQIKLQMEPFLKPPISFNDLVIVSTLF